MFQFTFYYVRTSANENVNIRFLGPTTISFRYMMTSFLILWTEVSFSSQFSSCYSYFLEFRVPERSHRFSEFKHKMMVFTSGHLKKFNAFALSSPHWIVSILPLFAFFCWHAMKQMKCDNIKKLKELSLLNHWMGFEGGSRPIISLISRLSTLC